MYLPFGPIGSNRYVYGDKTMNTRVRQYIYRLGQIQNKDRFDLYKKLYKFCVEKAMMKRAHYRSVKQKRPLEIKPLYLYFGMLPFMYDRWVAKWGKITMKRFLIVTSMYNAHLSSLINWGGFESFTRTLVMTFSHEFTSTDWQIAVNYMIKRKFIRLCPDQDLMKYFFRSATDKSNHPVCYKIAREEFFQFTGDGKRVMKAFIEHEMDYIDRYNHNTEFFRIAQMPDDVKKEFRAQRKALFRGDRRKDSLELFKLKKDWKE